MRRIADLIWKRPKAVPQEVPLDRTGPLGKRLKKYRCFDFELYIDPTDFLSGPVVAHGLYEFHVMPVFRNTVKAGMNVLDVGSNIGVYTVAAARIGARVLAIDANAENCKMVAINAALNNVEALVKALPFAVGEAFAMSLSPKTVESNKWINPLAKLTVEVFDGFDAYACVPLDALIGDERVDVVKIDIDGHEYNALKNARKLFSHRPVFFVEYALEMQRYNSAIEPIELLKLFVKNGYTLKVIGLRGPDIDFGVDVEAVDRFALAELKEAGQNLIDLIATPAESLNEKEVSDISRL